MISWKKVDEVLQYDIDIYTFNDNESDLHLFIFCKMQELMIFHFLKAAVTLVAGLLPNSATG